MAHLLKFWEDNWIPGGHNLKVQTCRGNNIVTTVDELINSVDHTWDVDLVRSIFRFRLLLEGVIAWLGTTIEMVSSR